MWKKIGISLFIFATILTLVAFGRMVGGYIWSLKLTEDSLKAQIQELYNQNQVLSYGMGLATDVVLNSIEKPTYDDMVSHTVQIFDIYDEKKLEGATGTGTIVKRTDEADYILTNAHVVSGFAENHRVVVIGDKSKLDFYDAKLVAISNNPEIDLALIKVTNLPNKIPISELATVKPQDMVYSVGFYLGMKHVYTEGTVAATYFEYTLANMPCAPGCSGSGVFDKYGRLVGVVFAGNVIPMGFYKSFDTAKSIIVPAHAVKLFLETNGITYNG